MKQKISNQMDGGLSTKQFADDLTRLMVVQITLHDSNRRITHAKILEVQDS